MRLSLLLASVTLMLAALNVQAANSVSYNSYEEVEKAFDSIHPLDVVKLTDRTFLKGNCYWSEDPSAKIPAGLGFFELKIALVKQLSADINSFVGFYDRHSNRFIELSRNPLSGDLNADYVTEIYSIRQRGQTVFAYSSVDRSAGSFLCVYQ
jgi:hypothetical protein